MLAIANSCHFSTVMVIGSNQPMEEVGALPERTAAVQESRTTRHAGRHPDGWLHIHRRGLLGPRMDAPATGVRLHLRQATLRSPARRTRASRARALHADRDYQNKLARFLENHDEPRAAATQSQCFVRLPFTDLDGGQWRLEDRMQGTAYDRDGCDLQRRGLYLDVRPWQASVFTLTRNPS
jgi:hypothetical protein